jgi:hypothetical protein
MCLIFLSKRDSLSFSLHNTARCNFGNFDFKKVSCTRPIRQIFINKCNVLFQYCPKLEELSLHGSMIKGDQLYSLGQCLHSLHTVTLYQCNVGELDRQGQCLMIDSSVIDRYNGKHLMVQFIDC